MSARPDDAEPEDVGFAQRLPDGSLLGIITRSALRQQPQLFELGGGQQVGFVADEDDPAVPFGDFGGQQVGGLPVETHIRCLRMGFRLRLSVAL